MAKQFKTKKVPLTAEILNAYSEKSHEDFQEYLVSSDKTNLGKQMNLKHPDPPTQATFSRGMRLLFA